MLLRVVRRSLVIFPGTPSTMFSFVTIIFTGITHCLAFTTLGCDSGNDVYAGIYVDYVVNIVDNF